jgi:hypothetical protein
MIGAVYTPQNKDRGARAHTDLGRTLGATPLDM